MCAFVIHLRCCLFSDGVVSFVKCTEHWHSPKIENLKENHFFLSSRHIDIFYIQIKKFCVWFILWSFIISSVCTVCGIAVESKRQQHQLQRKISNECLYNYTNTNFYFRKAIFMVKSRSKTTNYTILCVWKKQYANRTRKNAHCTPRQDYTPTINDKLQGGYVMLLPTCLLYGYNIFFIIISSSKRSIYVMLVGFVLF